MPRKTGSGISENEIIRFIRRNFVRRTALVKHGIGDDAAVLRVRGAREYWVLSTDLLLEGVDFSRAWTTPAQLGHKALAVNLSDVAAMGARPRFYTVGLALPLGFTLNWINRFYRGMTDLSERYNATLVGGDLSRSPNGIHISVTVVGETRHRRILSRSGGKPGDMLYVTGVLGKSASGLKLLQTGVLRGRSDSQRDALKSHRMPAPRCEVGSWLAEAGIARAMMDVSDGLSMDLPRLCDESGTGAEVYSSNLPVFEPSRTWGCDPLELGLHGGEDYELLFAVPPAKMPELEKLYPREYPGISRIGRLTRNRRVVYSEEAGAQSRPLPERGFDHFRT